MGYKVHLSPHLRFRDSPADISLPAARTPALTSMLITPADVRGNIKLAFVEAWSRRRSSRRSTSIRHVPSIYSGKQELWGMGPPSGRLRTAYPVARRVDRPTFAGYAVSPNNGWCQCSAADGRSAAPAVSAHRRWRHAPRIAIAADGKASILAFPSALVMWSRVTTLLRGLRIVCDEAAPLRPVPVGDTGP